MKKPILYLLYIVVLLTLLYFDVVLTFVMDTIRDGSLFHHILYIMLFPIPVNLSSWRREALLPFNSTNTDLLISSGNCWKALMFVAPVFSFINIITWSSEGRPFEASSISRQVTSSDKGSYTKAFSSLYGIRFRTV